MKILHFAFGTLLMSSIVAGHSPAADSSSQRSSAPAKVPVIMVLDSSENTLTTADPQ
jgi:hypothetical protein